MSCCFVENGPTRKFSLLLDSWVHSFCGDKKEEKKSKITRRIISHIEEKIIITPDSLLVDAQKTAALLLSSLCCRACVRARVDVDDGFFFLEEERGLSI